MRISMVNHISQHLEYRICGKKILLEVEDPDEVLVPSDWPIFLTDNLELKNSERSGSVLDLGTGSGIIAIALHKMGCRKVDASDINPIALETVRQNLSLNEFEGNCQLFRSDVFEKISNTYDLIVTNPPTFPEETSFRRNHYIDYAFFSGSNGREFIDKVIKDVNKFLVDGGRLIMLHPSYLNTKLTLDTLKKKNFKVNIVSSQNISLDDYSIFLSQNGYDAEILKNKLIQNAKSLGCDLILSEPKSTYKFSLDLVEAIKPERNANVKNS